MDLSALIFVALAVAWAVYLIPMALKRDEDATRSRSIDRFSGSLRVLARREPAGSGRSSLVVSSDRVEVVAESVTDAERSVLATERPGDGTVVVEEAPSAAGADKVRIRRTPPRSSAPARSRSASAVAARRRRRVLGAVLLANLVLVALATAHVVAWPWLGTTGALLVVWLVACRLMVRGERSRGAERPRDARPAREVDEPVRAERDVPVDDGGPLTEDMPAVSADAEAAEVVAAEDPAATTDPAAWDLRPAPLPTYVGKATASRAVRTIDLDSTGVWSSGRNAGDSEIAREAEEAERTAKADREATASRRATGS